MSPWIGMILISFLTGLLMLLIFRFTSNQQGIRKVKNKIKAHLLELRLYKDSMRISLKAQGGIFRANFKYIVYATKPMLVIFIPVCLILIQLNFWFAYNSLIPGEKAILKIKLKDNYNPLNLNLVIEPSSGIGIDTPSLRIEEDGEINWRISAKEKGVHDLYILVNGKKITKKVSIAQKALSKISPLKIQHNVIDEFLNPGEPPLPKDTPIRSVEITYPLKNMNFFGLHLHWLIAYLALSIIFGFAFKGIFKVEI